MLARTLLGALALLALLKRPTPASFPAAAPAAPLDIRMMDEALPGHHRCAAPKAAAPYAKPRPAPSPTDQ